MKIEITSRQCTLIMIAVTAEIKALEKNYKRGGHSKLFFEEKLKELTDIYSLLLKASMEKE